MTNGRQNSERLSGRIEAVPELKQLSVTLLQKRYPVTKHVVSTSLMC